MLLINGRFLTQRTTGVQRHSREVAAALMRILPGDVEVLTPPNTGSERGGMDPALRPAVREVGCLRGQMWEQWSLPRACHQNDALLLSLANLGPLAISNQMLTVHDVFAITHPEWVGRRFSAWYQFLLPRLVRRVRAILTVSEHSRRQICATLNVPENRVHVVYNGVASTMQRTSDAEIARVRGNYGLPERFILAVGSIEPRKNLRGLLEGWRLMPKATRPGLVIAGAAGSPRVFKDAGLGDLFSEVDVHRVGFVPDEDLPAMYSAASVVAHVAHDEGFGMPPLEAACCRTPTVISSNPALREVMGAYAAIAEADDPRSIARALEQAITDPPSPEERERWAAALRTGYSWAAVAARVIEVARAVMPEAVANRSSSAETGPNASAPSPHR